MIILLYLAIVGLILVISSILFLGCYPFFQFYLFYFKKINARLLLITNFLIAVFWYFCFHYYLALLILNNDFKKLGVEVLILNDSWILTILINNSLTAESIFRSLFVETCVLLHFFGEKLNLTIIISNLF